ncbi:MAG: hypothetical protein GEV03_17525 [Streptosporangiales bacterium]|nr:hypothetical protein [Streptosporangiales bacterium]
MVVAVLAEVAVIAAQAVTLAGPARSSIADDRVHIPAIARARRVMTVFGGPVWIVVVLLLLAQLTADFGLSVLGAPWVLAIGFLGFVGRHRLRKIERSFA